MHFGWLQSFQAAKGEGLPGSAKSLWRKKRRPWEDALCLVGEVQGGAGGGAKKVDGGVISGVDLKAGWRAAPRRFRDESCGTSREIDELLLWECELADDLGWENSMSLDGKEIKPVNPKGYLL